MDEIFQPFASNTTPLLPKFNVYVNWRRKKWNPCSTTLGSTRWNPSPWSALQGVNICPSTVGLPLLGASAPKWNKVSLFSNTPLLALCALLSSPPFFHRHCQRIGRTLRRKYLFRLQLTMFGGYQPWCTPWHIRHIPWIVVFHLTETFRPSQPWLDDVAFIPSGPQVDSRWPCCDCARFVGCDCVIPGSGCQRARGQRRATTRSEVLGWKTGGDNHRRSGKRMKKK